MSDLQKMLDGLAARAAVDDATADAWAAAATRTATRRQRGRAVAATALLAVVAAAGLLVATSDRPGTRTLAPAGEDRGPSPQFASSSPLTASLTITQPPTSHAGLLADGRGWYSRADQLWTTSDGGATWTSVNLPAGMGDVQDYREVPGGPVLLVLTDPPLTATADTKLVELHRVDGEWRGVTVMATDVGGHFVDDGAQLVEVTTSMLETIVVTSPLSASCCASYSGDGGDGGAVQGTSYAGGTVWAVTGTGAGRMLERQGRNGAGAGPAELGADGDVTPPVEVDGLVVSVATPDAGPSGMRTWRASSDAGVTWRTVFTDPVAAVGDFVVGSSDPVRAGSLLRTFEEVGPTRMEEVDPVRGTGTVFTAEGLPDEHTQPNLDDPTFPDQDHGWVLANHQGLYATADGGRTWAAVPLPS